MKFSGVVYRAHDPKWSFTPLSGEGAKLSGGRFNPAGVAALYTATTIECAFKEYSQSFASKIHPLTICSYEVECEDVFDLTTEEAALSNGVEWADLDCPWRLMASNGQAPPTWIVTKRLIHAGAAGVLVRSFAPGATERDLNLILWDWGEASPHKITTYDPKGMLPKDQRSWLGPED